jgi:hypothetical protein
MEEIISLKTCLRINSRMCCMRLLMSGLKAEKCRVSSITVVKLFLIDYRAKISDRYMERYGMSSQDVFSPDRRLNSVSA